LADFGIPFDELIFGKPEADVYVGQKHVSSLIDTCAEIGWARTEEAVGGEGGKGLKGAVAPRDFNTVKPVDDTHVFKTGPRDIMRGEVRAAFASASAYVYAARVSVALSLSNTLLALLDCPIDPIFARPHVHRCFGTNRSPKASLTSSPP